MLLVRGDDASRVLPHVAPIVVADDPGLEEAVQQGLIDRQPLRDGLCLVVLKGLLQH